MTVFEYFYVIGVKDVLMIKNIYPTDLEITEAYRKDKKDGFRLLYHKYYERILSVCKRYSADKGEAMDFFQEAMIKINDKIGSFIPGGEGSLYGWMSRITINMIVDELRRRDRWRLVEINDVSDKDYIDPVYDEMGAVPVEEIYKMTMRLSASKRTVFNMYAIDGYSYKEISDLLGISEDGASSTMSKARKELGRMIKDYLKESGQ